jgi:hypothetical protein
MLKIYFQIWSRTPLRSRTSGSHRRAPSRHDRSFDSLATEPGPGEIRGRGRQRKANHHHHRLHVRTLATRREYRCRIVFFCSVPMWGHTLSAGNHCVFRSRLCGRLQFDGAAYYLGGDPSPWTCASICTYNEADSAIRRTRSTDIPCKTCCAAQLEPCTVYPDHDEHLPRI